jgi:heptosyltransferase-2
VLVADPCPRLTVGAAADAAVGERLERAGFGREPFLLLNSGGRRGGAKTFPALRFHAVLAALLEGAPLRAVVVAGPGEEESVRETTRGLPPERVLAWIDPVADLQGLAALAARARLVLTADSGPRHVAAAVGARVVALLGPSDPRHGAACTTRTDLVRIDVPCGPCHRELCPLEPPDHHVCMREIDLDALVALVLARLGPL